MQNYFLSFLSVLVTTKSLSISCSPPQSFSLLPNSAYEAQVTSSIIPNSFIIGAYNIDPYISFNNTSGKWNTSLSFYSLESYMDSSCSLQIPGMTPNTGLILSVCSFNSSIPETLQISVKMNQLTCSSCKNYKTCLNGECVCLNDFFGDDCGLQYEAVNDYYSGTFVIEGYSLMFFKLNTSQQLYIGEDIRTIHIFLQNKTLVPSFFDFTDFATPKFSTLNGSDSALFISVFCPQTIPCRFTLYGNPVLQSTSFNYLILLYIFAPITIALIVIVILVVCGKRRQRLAIQGLDTKEIDKYAPINEWKAESENDICSVCLTKFKEKEDLRKIKKCSHFFHPECLDEWLKQKPKCPNCNLVLR